MSENSIFKIRKLKKSFGKRQVLKDINLEVRQGEILGLIGQSGSGKTTLLHTMIGFLKPDQGVVEALIEPPHRALGGPTYKDLYKNMNAVKQLYGFASQMPSFYNNLTVRENLEYFGSLYDLPKKTLQTNAEILLHLMDLEPAEKMLAKNLSGGMERRLDIACALMHDPAVLILDEPTADLDPILRNHIYDLIKKINNKNTTIVLASHHLSDIEHVCDRIAILNEGSIIAVGSPDQIKDKYSSTLTIHLKTNKQSYDDMASELRHHHLFSEVNVVGSELHLHTTSADDAVKEILDTVARHHQKIDVLLISKPSLDEIFIRLLGEQGDQE